MKRKSLCGLIAILLAFSFFPPLLAQPPIYKPQRRLRGESHFGVHLGYSDYASYADYIRELGDIYVRDGIPRDNFGWKVVKKVKSMYFCQSTSREGLLQGSRFESFYNQNFNLFATVEANRYGDLQPESLRAAYPYGHEDNYRDYLAYLVGALGERLKYWSVGIEADISEFWAGTPKDYAKMVELTSDGIKKRCPDCKVGVSFSSLKPTAGKAQKQTDWFAPMAKVCDYFDFIDLHYFDGPKQLSLDELETYGLNPWRKTCPAKEIISTSTAIPDYPIIKKGRLGGSREKQAQDLIKLITTMFSAGYNKVFWYLIDYDCHPDIPDDLWDHAGLLTENFERKPAFYSFKTMIAKVDYFTSITKLGDGQYKFTFAKKDPVYILWCTGPNCSLPEEITGEVKVTDYQGNTEKKEASAVVLGASPIFVESGCKNHYTVTCQYQNQEVKNIPCTSDSQCSPENMLSYCQPGRPMLLKCKDAKYYCAKDGFCKGCDCP